jgi:hypothetical protein
MRPLLVLFALALAVGPALAEETDLLKGSRVLPPDPAPAPSGETDLLKGSRVLPPSGVAATPDGRVMLTPETCAHLARLLPNGGDLKPGVDAQGRAVAPADLAGASRPQINNFPVEITSDLQRRLGIPANPNSFQPLLRLGFVTIRDNRAYFNGEPLSDPDQAQLTTACRAIQGKK